MGRRKYGEPTFKYGEGTHHYGEISEETLTDLTLGGHLGSCNLADMYYAGSTKISVPTIFPLQVKGYKIIFYNRDGEKVGEVSSETEQSQLISCEFELIDIGCGSFNIVLSQLPAELEDITYNYRVDIHLFGDTNPWYSGYIIKLPQKGATEKQWKYEGFGYYNQLENITVNRNYQNKQITFIVRDIVSTIIEPNTDIVYASNKIGNSSIIVEDIRWDRVFAKEVMKQLSELVLGYEFGVDHERKFFFRQKDTSINQYAHWWAGKHLNTFIPDVDIDKVRNKLHIYSGQVKGTEGEKTNYVCTVEDVASQALYGIREDKLTMPSVLTDDNAEAWGEYQLTVLAYPQQPAKTTGIEVFKYKIEAKGKARIISIDGLHEYELPIKRVRYKISSDGLKVDVELGEKDASFTAEQLALQQKIITAEQLEEQRNRVS